MPNRILRDGIIRSERVCQLSPIAELFYRRLMSVADDYGRYFAHEALLLSDCYPLRPGWADVAMISQCLWECDEAGLISTYSVDGTKYLEIHNFEQRVRPGQKSKFPPPAESSREMRRIPAQSEAYSESESEAKAGLAESKPTAMPQKTLRSPEGRVDLNPVWVKAQEALRASREAIARARDPVAYETAILRRVVSS